MLKNWQELGFTDDDLRRLELRILKNPKTGAVVQGTGGLRKMRFAFEGAGKSGSTRVCYVDFVIHKNRMKEFKDMDPVRTDRVSVWINKANDLLINNELIPAKVLR